MPIAEDLAAHWLTKGVIASVDDVLTGGMAQIPDGDGPYISVVETAGAGAEYRQEVEGTSMEMPGAQVTVRSTDYVEARTLARALWAALPVFNASIGGTWYRSLRPLQSPYELGLDATQRRTRFVFNVIGDKKPS